MLNYCVNHIPRNTPYNRRPGIAMNPEYITIHNTANPTSIASGEREWLVNPLNTVEASFHIVVDEKGAIEVIPLNEVAWHAGDKQGPGNMCSIGIEITESGDYMQAQRNAEILVAKILLQCGWTIDRLRRHYDWSGKICPRKMYSDGTWAGWEKFKHNVQTLIQLAQCICPRSITRSR